MAKLRIAEIFASIQGEGIWVGTPSGFVRVSGCNLRCVWCDTPYASWAPEGPILAIEDIVSQVGGYGLEHVVLTGGEPMLFDPVVDLARLLKSKGHTITIETAGTVYRDLPCDLMSVSPKLSNSTPSGEWAVRHEALRLYRGPLVRLAEGYSAQLKFVVNPDEPEAFQRDLQEIDEVLAQVRGVPPGRVLLMPEGTDSPTLARRMALLAPVCLAQGYRLSPRLHIDLFGNTKGT